MTREAGIVDQRKMLITPYFAQDSGLNQAVSDVSDKFKKGNLHNGSFLEHSRPEPACA